MHAKSHQWCTSRARSMVEAQRWRARPGIPDLVVSNANGRAMRLRYLFAYTVSVRV